MPAKPLVRAVGLAALAASTAAPSSARPAEPAHPAVVRAAARLRSARGPDKYTALRTLWRTWDRTDPTEVEDALRAYVEDGATDPPSRAYASLLLAYGRRRRGDLDGARRAVSALGFVDRWLALGPFDNEGKAGLARALGPEAELDRPLDPQRPYEGKERPVRWRAAPDVYPYGWVDLGDMVRPREHVCAYATTFVRSKAQAAAARPASVWVGASGAFRLYWNGEQILDDTSYRELDADRVATAVLVKPGWNRLTAKVCGEAGSPMLSLRLADARGAPDSALEASNDVAHAAAAASNAVASKAKADRPAADRVVVEAAGKQGRVLKAPEPPARQAAAGALEGPMQAFGRLAADKTAPPDLLESFARYLLLTAGDDPSENRARELARRAAERGPTTERLLLAGKLSEDRNQQREWVEKAARLAAGRDDVEVLLAQAHLARTGANWRDAVPFYDRVLAIDPDHTEALLGRVNLYEEAGLKRTALAALEAAVARNPRSVALLGAHAAALSGLGRQTEADEVSNRYAAYRFDDPTVLGSRLALAVARRDKPLALHWIARLLGADPDSASGLDAAAHAYRALGMPEQALGCYRKALELAPEDTAAMAAMAEMLGELGRRAEQLQLLRRILVLRPQTKEVREYVEHIEPPRPRSDEAFAWEPDKFLALRSAPAGGYNRRTLRDLQVTTVFPSGLSSRFRQVVFQPLTDEAAAAARQYAFVYQADREVVQLRAGRVYRADGRVDEALESAEGPADDPSIAMYTSSRTFYVQLPRIGPGDVVELRYRVEDVTPRNELADYFGEVRYMQSSEPVLGAEYVVVAPRSRALHFSAAGLTGLVREDKDAGDQHVTRFVVSSVPPVSPEPDMPAWAEILGHVHVSTYRSWDDVAKWYWGLSRDQLVPDDEVRALVDRVTKGLGTERDKVRAVYDYVVQKTRYVALEFGIFGFKPRRASQTFARGWGDCKDKAALIVTMLRVAGIPAHMVMVRSALRGDFPTDPASLAPFDHAIAYVPSLDLFLDGTAEYSGSGELPALDRGSLALVVTESGGKIVHLPDPPAQDSQRVHKLDATLAPNGSAALELRFEATGAFASEWRQRYHGESTRRERIGRDVAAELPGFELAQGPGALETADLDDIELPVRVRARGRAPGFARKEGNDLSVPVTPKDRFVPRLASLSQRRLDVRLKFQSVLDETWTVRIPAGLVVKSLPAPKSAQTPFGTLDLTVDHKEGVVGVRSRVTFSRIRVPSRDYPAFQAFCEQIDRALGQRLVLGRSR